MFSWIKRNKFNDKVNEFKQIVTNICTEEHRKEGFLDEMYTISLTKNEGYSIIASVEIIEDGDIMMHFGKGIIYDVAFGVQFSSIGTIVSYVSENKKLELLEFDANNEKQIFSRYIDLFLEIYIHDVHKSMIQNLEIDFSNQPVIFRDIVNYVQKNTNVYEYNNTSKVLYCVEGDCNEKYEFYICLNRNAGLLEIRFELNSNAEDIGQLLNSIIFNYKNRTAQIYLAGHPDLETDDIKGDINNTLNSFYNEFRENEKKYLNGELVL